MKRTVSIVGTGPFALEVYEWLRDSTQDFATASFAGWIGDPGGIAVQSIGGPCVDDDGAPTDPAHELVCAIADPSVKRKVTGKLTARGAAFRTLVHPTAIASHVQIGAGTVICPNVVIGRNAVVGTFVTINYQTGIGHESRIGAYSTISPGVQIGGRTIIEDNVFIGLSAAIVDNTRIGAEAVINMGSVVMGRVRAASKVSGNPARRVETF